MKELTFTSLRARLTALYFAAMAGLLVVLGVITYASISLYFQSTTDLALRQKMATELQYLGVALPSDLQLANQEWTSRRGAPQPAPQTHSDDNHGSEDDGRVKPPVNGSRVSPLLAPETFDGDLSAIFVVPLDAQGLHIISGTNLVPASFTPDAQAIQAAQLSGSDLRTVQLDGGVRVRLYTYHLPSNPSVVATLQLGRVLTDQELVLRQLLTGLLVVGIGLVIVATLCSWLLAGRSLLPAHQAWERQRLFVANASHELRTPLSIIQLSAEVSARDDTSEDERRELAGDILRETQYMTRLVADLLLLSRLDVGQIKLEMTAVPLNDLLEEAQRDMARLADEHGVSLTVEDSQGVVNADRMRLRQVLLILIDNALRHTAAYGAAHGESGRVTLKSATHGRGVTITVKDTGSGIAPEHLSRIFDRFYQSDEAHSKKGSAGLGLSIAKSLIEAMHGHISISSEVGKGTLVTLQMSDFSEKSDI